MCSQIFLSWTFQTTRVLCTWIKTLLVVAYSLKTSCDLYCTSDCFSCAIVDLAINQSPRGLSFDIFDKFT